MRKRHEWLAKPIKGRRIKRAARLRNGMQDAIDRKAIVDGAEDGLGTPIGSHLTPNDPGYVDLTNVYPHDPEKAKALGNFSRLVFRTLSGDAANEAPRSAA